jgi:hypothetical protein
MPVLTLLTVNSLNTTTVQPMCRFEMLCDGVSYKNANIVLEISCYVLLVECKIGLSWQPCRSCFCYSVCSNNGYKCANKFSIKIDYKYFE